ncbi:MAG: very short patch repair endonuclease [Pseudomonadota bacterium]
MESSLSPEDKRALMARFRSRDTHPEKLVRTALHNRGLRFRIHRKDLPGKPDIVLPKYRTIIFVHGCFWHRHRGCKIATTPKTRPDFWRGKFEATIERDRKNLSKLEENGWRVLVVWECEARDPGSLGDFVAEHFPAKSDVKNIRFATNGVP